MPIEQSKQNIAGKSGIMNNMAPTSETNRFLSSGKLVVLFVVLSFVVVMGMCGVTKNYLEFNETRAGFTIWDPAFEIFDPIMLNWPIFTITYIAILGGLVFALSSPAKILQTNLTIITILSLRIICMYCVPLDPPPDIIPLIDPFLSSTFYGNQVLVKDLFFSGHTASMVMLALLIDHKWVSRTLWVISAVIGSMLILQHVHYTLDVVAAYGFAWMAYKIGTWCRDQLILYIRSYSVSNMQRIKYRF